MNTNSIAAVKPACAKPARVCKMNVFAKPCAKPCATATPVSFSDATAPSAKFMAGGGGGGRIGGGMVIG